MTVSRSKLGEKPAPIASDKPTRQELIKWLTNWYKYQQNYKYLDFDTYYEFFTDRQLLKNYKQILEALKYDAINAK